MLLDAISDLSTTSAQAAVEWIADRTSLARDGWVIYGLRIVVAAFVFLAIAVGIPLLLIVVAWWAALKFLFTG